MTKRIETGKVSNGLMNVNIKPKITKEELKMKIANMRARDAETIVGIFKNNETPGGTLRFGLKLYPGDEFEQYELRDGERYCLPRGVVRHLNKECSYLEYSQPDGSFPSDSKGIRTAGVSDGRLKTIDNVLVTKPVHRFSFFNLDFMDDDEEFAQSSLLQVAKV